MRTFEEPGGNQPVRRPEMRRALSLAAVILVATLVLGILAFSGLVAATAALARLLFYVFLAVLLIALVMGFVWARRRV